jgi:Uncharacterized protein conserved in bacteria (DUF2330)
MRTRLLLLLVALASPRAHACGCLAPPDPTNPVVQSRERIFFAVRGNEITAHIQLAFDQNTSSFAWLLPLPAVPDVSVGRNELFTALAAATQPSFQLTEAPPDCGGGRAARRSGCEGDCGGGFGGGGGYYGGSGDRYGRNGLPNPVVLQDTVGPYDYAVVRGDDDTALLDWLARNRYFVPTGTPGVLRPYVHPGAYFLAVKLAPNGATGDLQPIVVHYTSDLPMIPIILTSVTVAQRLPITAWILGPARAIPRNYYHVLLDDARIDWVGGAANYNDLVALAVAETPKHHGFVTEYAGPSEIVHDLSPSETELFRGLPKLTRLYTILTAADMTDDPVFSFNPDLELVASAHPATLTLGCAGTDGTLTTADGLRLPFANGKPTVPADLPAALRVEILREAGPPEIVADHRDAIESALAGMAPPPPTGDNPDAGPISRAPSRPFTLAALALLALLLRPRRRR